MANTKTKPTKTTKSKAPKRNPVEEFLESLDVAESELQEFEAKHHGVIAEYMALLDQLKTVAEALKSYCVENFEELLDEKIGPITVGSQRKVDLKALVSVLGEEVAEAIGERQLVVTMSDLESAIRKEVVREDIVDQVTTLSPVIRGMPKVELGRKV